MARAPRRDPAGDPDGEAPDGISDPAEEAPEQRVAPVTEALHGQRLDRALVVLAPEFSRSHLQGLVAAGHVALDGQVTTLPARKVRAGQRLEVLLVPTAKTRAFRPEDVRLPIVFEDEHLLVVDKPAGLVVHPAAGNWSGTLLNGLLAHVPAAAALPRAGIVHRLDKDTSGLMVVGKTLPATTALVRAIAARAVQRRYLAIVHGILREDAFSIEAPIGRDPRSRVRMAVVASGKPARTDVECLARTDVYSVVACTLHTGRTHQIRVHLATRDFPLVGDGLYGGVPALGLDRQALHAARLGFAHPATQARMTFEAPPPPDLQEALETLGIRHTRA